MPVSAPRDGGLVAVVELETAERWMLRTVTAEDAPSVLVLQLSPGGAGHPGSAGYRSSKAGHPERIEILCQGKLHHIIGEVMSVY